MTTHTLDVTGVQRPHPILRITEMLPAVSPGDILEVTSDCPAFGDDVTTWCTRMNKALLALNATGGVTFAQIQF